MHSPVMPVRATIKTENIESRARVGFDSPVSIVLPIRASSITITEPVSTSVPKGSPNSSANSSAWRATCKESTTTTLPRRIKPSTMVLALPASSHSSIPVKLNSANTPAPIESVESSGNSRRSRLNAVGPQSPTQWTQSCVNVS